MFRSDGEPAIIELKREAMKSASQQCGIEFIPEVTPKGVSAANGLAEGAVKEIKAKCRTLKYATDLMYGTELPSTHPCLPWLVLYSAQLINRARRGPDGRTPFE